PPQRPKARFPPAHCVRAASTSPPKRFVKSAVPLPAHSVGQLRFVRRAMAAHPAQRQEKTDERLGSLVLAWALRIEAVGHRARCLIVKGHAKPVLAQKPGESRPGHLEVAGLLGQPVGCIAGLDQIPRVDGLLAKDRPAFSPFDPAVVANEVKVRAGPSEPEEEVEGYQSHLLEARLSGDLVS